MMLCVLDLSAFGRNFLRGSSANTPFSIPDGKWPSSYRGLLAEVSWPEPWAGKALRARSAFHSTSESAQRASRWAKSKELLSLGSYLDTNWGLIDHGWVTWIIRVGYMIMMCSDAPADLFTRYARLLVLSISTNKTGRCIGGEKNMTVNK